MTTPEPGWYYAYELAAGDLPEGWHCVFVEADGSVYDSVFGASRPRPSGDVLLGPRVPLPGPPRLVGALPEGLGDTEYEITIRAVETDTEEGA